MLTSSRWQSEAWVAQACPGSAATSCTQEPACFLHQKFLFLLTELWTWHVGTDSAQPRDSIQACGQPSLLHIISRAAPAGAGNWLNLLGGDPIFT